MQLHARRPPDPLDQSADRAGVFQGHRNGERGHVPSQVARLEPVGPLLPDRRFERIGVFFFPVPRLKGVQRVPFGQACVCRFDDPFRFGMIFARELQDGVPAEPQAHLGPLWRRQHDGVVVGAEAKTAFRRRALEKAER